MRSIVRCRPCKRVRPRCVSGPVPSWPCGVSLPRTKCGPPVHIAEPAWCSLVVLLRGAYAARDAEWSNYVVMPALFFRSPGNRPSWLWWLMDECMWSWWVWGHTRTHIFPPDRGGGPVCVQRDTPVSNLVMVLRRVWSTDGSDTRERVLACGELLRAWGVGKIFRNQT